MPGSKEKCCICNTTIQAPSEGRTITSNLHERLKTFLCRKIAIGVDHGHKTCILHPNKYSVVQNPVSHLDTLADVATYVQHDYDAYEDGKEHKYDDKENIAPTPDNINHISHNTNKRSIDALTPEEQHLILKRLKTHHANPDGTLTLQSANHTNVKLLPLSTPQLDKILQQQQLLSASTPTPTRQNIKNSIRTSLSNIAWHDQCIQQCTQLQQQHQPHTPFWYAFESKRQQFTLKKKQEEQLLHQLEDKWYTAQGHFTRQLDDVITSLNVKRQRYHGGAFVGNDCVRLLKGRDAIADVLKPQQFETMDGKCKHMIGSHEQSQLALHLLSRLYSLHSLYCLARPLCNHEVDELTSKCHEFGNWFPTHFPKHRITPKMHVMIYHMPELAQRYRTVGMFSEHAGEAIHTVFNKLNRQYVYLGSDLKRLDSVMSRCLRLHDPRVLDFVQSRNVEKQ